MYNELSLKKICGSKTEELANVGREEKHAVGSVSNAAFIPGFCGNQNTKKGTSFCWEGPMLL